MKPIIDSLESERLYLEVRKESHAAEVYPFFCEPDLYRYTIRDVPPGADWLAEGFRGLETLQSPDGKEIWLGWIAREKSSRHPVGVFETSIVNDEAFLSYILFKQFWGKGLAAEATKRTMEYVAKHYPLNRFVIEMDTRNRASTKVAEKLGFDFVKVSTNACFLKGIVSHEFQFQKLL